ncbi:IS3 family transposase [Kribbella solani]|uniref:IS3 family transposase n=1 Tax=Kribbella solani TaxID=236067 RepID=UPI001EE2DEAB|nr:IS3 family transposase [Kribbella solani]
MKAQAVTALKADHRLEVLLEVAGLARSTFFYHQARLASPDPRAALKTAIREVFENNKGRYGHRRVHRELVTAGWRVAKKTVLALMRRLGLVCLVRRRRRYNSFKGQTSTTGATGKTAPNLLARDFTATAPNRKWVTDVTEFAIAGRKLYLSPVMDLFDRQIIAYTTSDSPNLQLTNSSLQQALTTQRPSPGLLVHSDQGFQYQHHSWQALLTTARATQSMSRKANCYDNAIIENFFGHLKEELFHHTTFTSADAFTTALADYIHWYNNHRTSTTLKGLSPVQYRTQTLTA